MDETDLEKIIQIMEGKSVLTPGEYKVGKKEYLDKILKDKDLAKELSSLYLKYMESELEIRKFITSVFKGEVRDLSS